MSIRWRARKGTDKDFCDLHAWAEIYVPGAGWVGFDVDLGIAVRRGAYPAGGDAALSVGRADYRHGRRGQHQFRVRDAGRPHSRGAARHQAVLRRNLGEARCAGRAGRSGPAEPTTCGSRWAASRPSSRSTISKAAEWNTAAVGPTKRALADTLIRKLRERFAPNGFLHYGQGKWYPGESLPRWAFALYWRKDGQPIWGDPALIAREAGPRDAAIEQAEKFTGDFADRLGVGAEFAVPAFEDPAVWALKEGELPENVDPTDPKIDDPETRARMVRTFERGLSKPSGFVLPIQAWQSQSTDRRWKSEKWKLRRGKLFLVPGDCPVGFRLPLGALPWVPRSDYPYVHPQDPTEPREPLPSREQLGADL